MSSFAAQVSRAHAQWLEPPEESRYYSREQLQDQIRSIELVLDEFVCSYFDEPVQGSGQVVEFIKEMQKLIEKLESMNRDLIEIEDNVEEEYL